MASGARNFVPGEMIAGSVYRIVRLIGAGGMGTVYEVEDTTIGKPYVLKVLHPQLGNREDLAHRMQKEARTLARLKHPNIVEVITAGVTADETRLPYFVMEKLVGQSLRLVLEKRHQLELPHAYHIGIDLLDALAQAHDLGVVHRDVKPDNIFLHQMANNVTLTKLLDFGIVALMTGDRRDTAGKFVGTLRYSAPEQILGDRPSPQTDLYSAALVIFEMVAGRGPFDDLGGSHEIGLAHAKRTAPRLSQFVFDVPNELTSLLAAALSKNPQQRPRDAYSFAASLRNLKRALAPHRPGWAEPSATGAAVGAALGAAPAPAPYVHLRPSAAPDGGYVVAPVATPAAPAPTGVAQVTMRMAAPTPGATERNDAKTATSAQVDRDDPTHTSAPQTPRMPRDGTEALAPAAVPVTTQRALPLAAAMHESSAPLRWPPEKPLASSDDAQVRSLHDAAPPPTSRAAVAALVGAVTLGVVVAGLMFVKRASLSRSASTAPVVVSALPPPPEPSPVVAQPAPTLAPPALEDVPAPSAATAAPSASTTTVASATPPRPTAVATATARPKPATPPRGSSALAPDRPGPGF